MKDDGLNIRKNGEDLRYVGVPTIEAWITPSKYRDEESLHCTPVEVEIIVEDL